MCAALTGLALFAKADAAEWFGAANTLDEKSWSLGAYYETSETEPVVKISGVNSIQVPLSGGGSSTIFAGTGAEVEMEQKTAANVAIFKFRPRSGLQYSVRAGQVRSFELEFSSGSQTNKLESTKDGFLWGIGLGRYIAVGSMVSTAISWDLNYTQTRAHLDRLQGGTNVFPVSERLEQEEFQAAVNFSKRWKRIEPYAGVKVNTVKTTLKDPGTKAEVSGRTEGVSPFVGLEVALAEHEFLTVEASFVDQKSVAAGINIQF